MKLVSVIVPTFNSGKKLERSLNSILNQSYSNIEILVIDDGSTDGTAELSILSNEKIRYYYQENKGQGEARNLGLKLSLGDYLSFVDSDDEITSDFLFKMINHLEDTSSDVAECNYQIIKKKNRVVDINIYQDKEKYVHKSNYKSFLLEKGLSLPNSTYSVCNKVYKKECFSGLKFSGIPYSEDYLMNTMIFSKSDYQVVGLNIYGYKYYINESSTTRSRLTDKDFLMLTNLNSALSYASNNEELELLKARYYHGFYSLFIKGIRQGVHLEDDELLSKIKTGMKNGKKSVMKSPTPIMRKGVLFLCNLFSTLIGMKVR